jgi:hypothetical protein
MSYSIIHIQDFIRELWFEAFNPLARDLGAIYDSDIERCVNAAMTSTTATFKNPFSGRPAFL